MCSAAWLEVVTVRGIPLLSMPKKAGNTPSPSTAADNNRKNQKNPNHPAYWQSQGQASRPANYQQVIDQRREAGQCEAELNRRVHETRATRAAIGRVTRKVEAAVKEACGPQARVEKGGSRHKRTNLAGADLDLKVVLPGNQPMRTEGREQLTECLVKHFGSHKVDTSNPRIHIVEGEVCSIDLVPVQSTYAQENFHAGLPKNPFQQNDKARLAARDVKDEAVKRGTKLRGHDVEMEVLQQQHLDLNDKAHMQGGSKVKHSVHVGFL